MWHKTCLVPAHVTIGCFGVPPILPGDSSLHGRSAAGHLQEAGPWLEHVSVALCQACQGQGCPSEGRAQTATQPNGPTAPYMPACPDTQQAVTGASPAPWAWLLHIMGPITCMSLRLSGPSTFNTPTAA